uniref:Uncharacterized protein n=1 Tax=Fagus sylvatica TaxID=28930 RepID=A0A2N9HHW1_FAGSY
MKNSGKGVRLPEGSSSSDEDTEMSPPAKSMVDELKSYLDTRIQERMVAFNENVQTEPPMVQKDDTTQLLLQILNDQNERMKKLEQAVSNTKHFTQNIAAFVQGMSQKNTTRGIEVGQGSGQQPQIEMVTTNVEIPIGYPVNPVIITKLIKVEPPHFEPPRVEPPRMESPRFEPPRVEQPRVEPPRVDPPRVEQPRVEPPRMEQLRFEPPSHQEWIHLDSSSQEWNHQGLNHQGWSNQEWIHLDSSSQGWKNQEWNSLGLSNLGWNHLGLSNQGWNHLVLNNQGWNHLVSSNQGCINLGEEAPAAAGSSQPLEWKFAQVFGERTVGEEVQEGLDYLVSFNYNERRRFRGDRSYMRDDGWGSGVVVFIIDGGRSETRNGVAVSETLRK